MRVEYKLQLVKATMAIYDDVISFHGVTQEA